MDLALSFLFMVLGLLLALFPQWFCKQAGERKQLSTSGSIIFILGLVLLAIELLKQRASPPL